jgi:hypothetical protein
VILAGAMVPVFASTELPTPCVAEAICRQGYPEKSARSSYVK